MYMDDRSLTQNSVQSRTTVILPIGYDPSERYPALILMPLTNGSPAELFSWYFSRPYEENYEETPYIAILPKADVRGSVRDYQPLDALDRTIERYENSVKAAFDSLIPEYNIDPSRVALAGWSLGGDLAWAITLRNPTLFRGVMVIGSRSIRPNPSRMPELVAQVAQNDVRFFLAMGEQDIRLNDVRAAAYALGQQSVTHRLEIVPNAGHSDIFRQYAQNDIQVLSQQGVQYLLFDE